MSVGSRRRSARLSAGHREVVPSVLRKRADYLYAQQNGRRLRRPHLLLVTCSNDQGIARVGITVSRRVGKAVVRNRVRRRLRELFRAHAALFAPGNDYVFIASPSAASASFPVLQQELQWLMQRAGA